MLDVFPNGDLVVGGDQILDVNAERQYIRIEGRVRSADVSEANTIQSIRLANAKISYSGTGVVAEKQKPGIFQQILTWLGI